MMIRRCFTKFGLIAVICLLTNCISNSSNKFKESMGIVATQFEDSLFDHFPYKIDGSFRLEFVSPEKCKEEGQCGVFLITNFPHDQMNLKRDELIERGYLIRRFSDSLNIVVNGTSNNVLESSEAVPIPNFPEILNNSELMIKQKEVDITKFEVFVLEAKPGIFIQEDLLPNNPYLPSAWENGYNKGIAINSEELEIIFWFEIW